MTNKFQIRNSKIPNPAQFSLRFHSLVFVIYLFFGNCILFIPKTYATIHTVKQDGTGDYTTIQSGINAASNGDTVLVWPGTYFENINYFSKNITVASLYLTTGIQNYINTTIIDGANNGTCVFISDCTESNTMLCGFSIQNGSGYSNLKHGGGVFIDSSHIIIINCIIKDNTAKGGGGIYAKYSEIFLNGSIIKNNKALKHCGGILIAYNSQIHFDTLNLNSLYLNHGPQGSDFSKSLSCPPLTIILDTATVLIPDNHFFYSYDEMGYPINDLTWQINHPKVEQMNANLFVDPGGNNENNGLTPDQPLRTLAYAIDKIWPDSLNPKKIYLSSGIFSSSSNNEIFPITPRSFVSIVGSGVDITVVDAEYQFPLFESFLLNSNFKIKNISFERGIDNQATEPGIGGLNFFDNNNVMIEQIEVRETKGGARSGINSALSSLSILNSIILNNSGDYPLVLSNSGSMMKNVCLVNTIVEFNVPGNTYEEGKGGGIGFLGSYSFPNATKGKLINVRINENTVTVEPGGSKVICGLSCTQNAKVDVINTTIVNNVVTNPVPSAQVYAAEGAEINFYNSIVYGTEDYEIFLGDGTPTSDIATVNISNTDVKGGEENIQNWNNIHTLNWLEGNIDEDPQWEGGDPYNYALQPGSPCINSGVPMFETGMDYPYIKEENGKYVLYMLEGDTVTLPAYDLAGNPRISGGRIDMGAYEWQDTATQVGMFQVSGFMFKVYPNPFVSNVFVSFSTEREHEVLLEVIDMKGLLIRTITENQFPPGYYRLVWNGKDDRGMAVKPGNYVICLYLDGKLAGCEKVMKRS